jgi:hypothetical protein
MKKLLLLSALLPLFACSGSSGGGGSGSGSGPSGLDLLLTDAPADDLLYLRAEVQSFALVRADGSTTANLLGGSVSVDLLALDGVFEWLATGPLPAGTFSGVRVAFDGFGFEAADASGAPVAITATASTLDASFSAPLVADAGGYARVEVDFDLLASLQGEVTSGSLLLTPSGTAAASSGDDGIAIDEVKGTVVSFQPGTGALVLDAFADGDLAVPLGEIDVSVTSTTLLVDDDGSVFGSQDAFFGALVAGATLLEVHGNLVAGTVTATKIEIEDTFGSGGDVIVELRGKVVGHAPGVSLSLLIQEIKKGASIALPVLAGLGDPAAVTVGILPSTHFFLDDSQPTTEASLAVGQTVKVKFVDFASGPFPAFKVEIQNALPRFEGFITDVSGLPSEFVMHLRPSDPAILSGAVASTSTDVLVQIDGAGILLKVDDKPALTASDLLVGLKVEVLATLSGPPTAPVLDAGKVKVFAGRLDGALVSSKAPGAPSFTTFGGELKDPFGGGISAGPLTVQVEPGCAFDGDVESQSAFFAFGGALEVEVFGIGSGQPGEIRAFVVKSKTD